jgi:rhamnose transport system substrate-binding protein
MRRKTMKRQVLIFGAVALALLLVPLSRPMQAFAGGKAEQKGATAGGTMYMITKVAGIPYFELNSKPGAEEACKELGYKFVFAAPAQPTADAQIQLIEAAIAQHVSAILITADDPDALGPSLLKAKAAGITVVAWDSDVRPEYRQMFQNQCDAEQFGRSQLRYMYDELGGAGKAEGEVAILSAAATMTNQNTWIGWMKEEWKKPEYAKMKLVAVVYGNDVDQKSYDETLNLIKAYPNLKGIISPTSVGLVAAARAVEDKGLAGKIQLTGGSLPNQLRQYIKDGTIGKAALWNPKDQGYLTVYMADALIRHIVSGKEGEKFSAGRLGQYTVGKNGVVVLGPPLEFNKGNIDNYSF